MDRAWLETELAAGRSIEAIAKDVGRHPSTVAYWVNKHGLASRFAPRHAARGGIEREALAALVAEGLSIRAIAARLGVSYATVRHWLGRYDLHTERRARRVAVAASLSKSDDGTATAVCARHGETQFGRRDAGGWRCLKCRAEAVTARRRAVKATLVAEAGGRCVLCGYAKSPVALQFHHRDRDQKRFHIAHRGVARSLEAARAEARKCVLLCANCHAEVEAGLATIPLASADNPG